MHLQQPTRRNGVMAKRIGKETFLYDLELGSVHILNNSAQFIWDQCTGQHTIEDILKAMKKGFNVPADKNILEEIKATLMVFHDKGLLH